ncbi:UNVERIFIED_CONTAM: hypothetical protein Slati_3403300 [Sesamum latifolium]|uniref:Uncharacterized protein n=1 Tax=Sesamum latifolium TaxID=2727402 RepID=A0AAW2UFI5_9LAMI
MASHQLPLAGDSDPELEQSLSTLESFLGLLGYCQQTFLRATLSWLAFFLLAVALPLFALEFSRCPGCEKFEIESFELEILVARAWSPPFLFSACRGICASLLLLAGFMVWDLLSIEGSTGGYSFDTTENQSLINFINGGDFAVLSIVQLVGIVLCLSAAAKISHRAQSLGSIASRWHALVTCNSNDASGSGLIDNGGNAEFCPPAGPLPVNYSESDLESSDYMPLPTYAKITSSTSSYHRRQAFVTYVQSNTGGFTIFGWVVDRMLVNTIFFIELSLVFFVLGKTITITVK